MRRDEKDKVAGVRHGDLICRGSLEAWQIGESRISAEARESRISAEAGGLTFGKATDHERGISVIDRDVRGKLLAVEHRNVVYPRLR